MAKLRVLVIGAGSIGERHIRCFLETGRADVSVCELNPTLLEQIAERYKIEQTYTDLNKAIADAPQATVICTPAHFHIPMAAQLAAAGSHLLIEKPLSTSREGINQLIAAVSDQGLTAAVAYVTRGHPALSQMREAIQSGRFGKPLQLIAVGGQHFPFYRPAYRDIYYRDRATGGGAIQDALTHTMNVGQWLLGPVTQLAADADHLALEGVEVEDTVHVIARHGEVMASYSLNQHQAINESNLTVVCQRGVVRFEAHQCRWRWAAEPEQPWNDEASEPLKRDALFVRQADAFLDAVEKKTPPLCTLEEGWRTLCVNLTILKAVDSRTWQTLDYEM